MKADKVFKVVIKMTSPAWIIGLIVTNIILAIITGLIALVICVHERVKRRQYRDRDRT